MQVGQIVKLKSGSPNLTVEWEIGVTPTPANYPLGDISTMLKNQTGYDNGDNSCVWTVRNNQEKKVFPVEALMLLNTNLTPATNQALTMGCVVRVNGEEQEMTVNWIIGANCRPVKLIDTDQMLRLKGFQNGDVSCLWFDNRGQVHENVFSAATLTKIFD
jgi:uncharacterized protein YodC (DUF2158 family)